ncbi:hypothetical protein MAR_021080, partial [Mya arenaria]
IRLFGDGLVDKSGVSWIRLFGDGWANKSEVSWIRSEVWIRLFGDGWADKLRASWIRLFGVGWADKSEVWIRLFGDGLADKSGVNLIRLFGDGRAGGRLLAGIAVRMDLLNGQFSAKIGQLVVVKLRMLFLHVSVQKRYTGKRRTDVMNNISVVGTNLLKDTIVICHASLRLHETVVLNLPSAEILLSTTCDSKVSHASVYK